MKKIIINNSAQMADFACQIAQDREFKTIALSGSLGVGKSFFAKHFINYWQDQKQQILSPTFNIVCSYDTKIGEIFHFDLYRLKSESELENIDFFSIVNNHISLIEWPEIAENFLPKKYLEIKIIAPKQTNADNEQYREILLNYHGKI